MGSSSSKPFNYDAQLLSDRTMQSVEVADAEYEDSAKPRRSKLAAKELVDTAYKSGNDKVWTIWDAFQRGVTQNPNGNHLGTRKYTTSKGNLVKNADKTYKRGDYVWEKYKDVDQEVRTLGAGLVGLGAKSEDNIGIFSINRAEWVKAALALYGQKMRVVSLYATLGADAVEYIINHSESKIIFVSKANLPALLAVADKLPEVRHIIQFDVNETYGNSWETVDAEHVEKAKEFGINLVGLSDVMELGSKSEVFPNTPDKDDLAFIMYTSGTTGNPKGAMLRHINVVAAVSSVPMVFPLKPTDIHISYLPLAHIFETVVQASLWACGGSIGFFQGNVKLLTADFGALKPTILAGVPRVFTKVYQRVFSGVEEKNCIVRYFFNKAYNAQAEQVRQGRPPLEKWDKKIFIPLRTRIGLGNCRLILTGAAPCPPYLLEFLKIAIGASVCQGYGMTETAAGLTISLPSDPNVGHVGPPVPCAEVRLRDVAEMGYLHTDYPPRGEILVRGPCVFAGYFKNEKATKDTIDEEGWLATGDIGRWNPNGTLSIIDRKKNIFKLAQGEYIAAEKIEVEYGKCPNVGQIWVYGNSFKSFVVAAVVPNAEAYYEYATSRGWWPSAKGQTRVGSEQFLQDFHKLWTGPHASELKAHLKASLKEFEGDLHGFEKARDILVESQLDATLAGFNEGNNCLTPTFKLRRPFLLSRYYHGLRKLYTDNGEAPKADEKWPGAPEADEEKAN